MTRLELRRQRERLRRFERFLPALVLRQQQLQAAVLDAAAAAAAARSALAEASARFEGYAAVLRDVPGVDMRALARASEVRTGVRNVAGVPVPVLDTVEFAPARYSFFATPPWVDRALQDLRAITARRTELDMADQAANRLATELTRIRQRVNLFEKVEIPAARKAIHRIRIHLGDEMAAAVGRAKLARTRGAGHAAAGGTDEVGA